MGVSVFEMFHLQLCYSGHRIFPIRGLSEKSKCPEFPGSTCMHGDGKLIFVQVIRGPIDKL